MKVFNKLFADIQESYSELVYKVSWPTRTQLVNSAMIVLVASIILSLVIWGVDEVINFVMQFTQSLIKYVDHLLGLTEDHCLRLIDIKDPAQCPDLVPSSDGYVVLFGEIEDDLVL